MQRIEEFTPRNEGCHALLEDNGESQIVPVCMGGTALVGCNNANNCLEISRERRIDSSTVDVVFRSEDQTVITSIVQVCRGELTTEQVDQAIASRQ